MTDFTSISLAQNPWNLGGLSWREVVRRTWNEILEDDILGRAAQLAFYLLLALFPALLFLTALIGLVPLPAVIPEMLGYLRQILPSEALSLLERYLGEVIKGSGTGLLSLGFLGALWASSSGLTAIMETLNVAYDVAETRPFWKVRLIAMIMTIGLAGFIISSTVLVLAGEYIAGWVADELGFGAYFKMAWMILQWPVVMVLMLFAVAVVYQVAPNVRQDWRWVSPGSLFTVVMWLVVSLAFKLYAENFGSYNAAYGSIAGVIVLMMWFYLSGIVLLIGGEINAEIVRAANIQATQRAHQAPVLKRRGAYLSSRRRRLRRASGQ